MNDFDPTNPLHTPHPPTAGQSGGFGDGPIAGLLDTLGAADRAAMPEGLSGRAWAASLASLHGVVETSARAAELGAMDRASAGPELETRVHEATRGSLPAPAVHGPSLRLVGRETSGRVVVRRTLAWRVSAVAAALLIGGAGLAVLMSGKSATVAPAVVEVASTASIEAQLDLKMDTLLLAMQDVPAGGEDDSIGEFKPEWLDELTASTQRNGL